MRQVDHFKCLLDKSVWASWVTESGLSKVSNKCNQLLSSKFKDWSQTKTFTSLKSKRRIEKVSLRNVRIAKKKKN